MGDLDAVPSATQTAAYRIVQEALTNVARHADAARALVEIDVTARFVRLTVSDDGRQAVPAEHVPGRGLVGMRERAVVLGGTLVAGPAATGWLVKAELPL